MFFQVARQGKNGFFTYLLTIFLVIIALILGQLPLGMMISFKALELDLDPEAIQNIQKTLDFTVLGITSNLALVLILIPFIFGLLALILCIRNIHRKKLSWVITGRQKIDWSRVLFSFGLWFALNLLLEIVFYFADPGNYTLQFDGARFVILALIAVVLLPLQTSFEELFIRGYLLQGIGLLARNKWIPLLFTSLIFGLLHFLNPEVKAFGLGIMMTYYIFMGLMLGLCTILDNGLEIAFGVHAATNIYGAVIVTFPSSALQTPALFRLNSLNPELMIILGVFVWLFFIFVVARKYRWENWRSLFRPIVFNSPDSPTDKLMEKIH